MASKTAKRNPDEIKHRAILAAAIRLFLRHGYSTTSMDAIASEAGVTKQTVYAHYHSKGSLFTQMVAELARKHTPPARLAGRRESIEKGLYRLGMGFLGMITSREGLAATRLVVAEAQRHPKLAQHYYESGSRRMLTMGADFLSRQNAAGALAIPAPLSAASYFFSMLKGNYYLRILLNIKPHPSPGEKQKHVRETVAIFMRIYGGETPLHTRNVL